METNDDKESSGAEGPRVRRASGYERDVYVSTENEPMKRDGTPYSARYTADGVESKAWMVQKRQMAKRWAKMEDESVKKEIAKFLQGLPEFSESSEARIRKVSKEVVEMVSKTRREFDWCPE